MQSNTHIVLASIKRTSAEMGTFQRKLFKIDDHLGIGVAGLISDGRNLCRFMRNECLSHRCFTHSSHHKQMQGRSIYITFPDTVQIAMYLSEHCAVHARIWLPC